MMINDFKIGSGKTFIIAELSANHGGSFETAVKSLEAAKASGADAVKLQTYTADTITINSDNPIFKISGGTLWDGSTYYDLYKAAATPWEWQNELKELADKIGITLFSSPFDKTAVDFLENINVPAYKIASFEINDIPLIKYAASKGKPMILSTGAALKEEIDDAVAACRAAGNNDIVLLKCTSAYPAPYDEANLYMIARMKNDYGCLTGLSDHTLNNAVAVAAAALGASVIEKHFILDKSVEAPDKAFSLDAVEFKEFVNSIRIAEAALGKDDYEISPSSKKGRAFMRSLYAVKDIEKGELFSYNNIGSFRPFAEISPKYMESLAGKAALRPVKAGEPITKDMYNNL